MSNAIPSGWVESSLEPYCEKITDGAHLSPPTSSEGFPIATVENMRARHIDIQSCRTISKSDFESLQRNSCAPELGDVLFSKDGTIGKTFVFQQRVDVVLLSSIAIIRTKKAKLVPEFLTQYLKSPFFFRSIEHATSGSAIRRVVLKDIKALPIKLPPVLEQQKIASILTAVDEVIASTTAQINKLKDLKTGMMQELLTKGIGHTEFKDSPVGRIPKAWKVTIFEKIALKIQDGTHFSPQSKEGECLYITSKNIQDGKLDLRRIQYISQAEHDEIYKRCNVQFGDVLLTKDGANTGNCAMNTLTQPFSLLSSVAFLRCDELICLNEFLYQYILSMSCQKQIADSMTGNAITRLTLTIIKGLRIVLPTIGEQRKIVNALGSIDKRIDQKEDKLKMILNTKKALMQDLLTGKVRVSNL
jgi:type I restriction enzyme S subunit